LVHDTLVVLNRIDDYAKIASRAQAMSLIANAGLVAAIPLLYPIDKRLPFVAGIIAYSFLYLIASLLLEPNVHHDASKEEAKFISTVRLMLTRKTVAFFLCVGFAYAAMTGTVDVYNLAQIELGLPVKYMGLIFGGASLFGAFLGFWVHHLKKLSFKAYASVDMFVNLIPFIAYGILRSLPIAIVTFIINFGFWRYQQIMYQHYVLQIYGTSRYKATVISLLTNFRSFNEIWIALASTTAARHFGILDTIGYGTIVVALFWPLLLLSINQFSANAKAEAASVNQ
jgi:hypothetical protein